MAKKYQVRLAPAARRDVRETLRWSEREFGKSAASRYERFIRQALSDIERDPETPGSNHRPEMMAKNARTYHLSLSRSRVSGPHVKDPRHFFLYRRHEDGVIEVARLLHDDRDFERHIPEDYRQAEN